MLSILLVAAAVSVAFLNGANDSGKGVATLACSGELPPRRALRFAVGTTFLGALAAVAGGAALAAAFRGKGLIPDAAVADPAFLVSVAVGAAVTVGLATLLRLPVSTSHALLGGLIGAALASGAPIRPGGLLVVFVLPLAFSPLLAAALGWVAARAGRAMEQDAAAAGPAMAAGALGIAARPVYRSTRVHLLSSGLLSFARGFQDTPKIAALLFLAPALAGWPAVIATGVAMALGGWFAGAGVARKVSSEVCCCRPSEGCGANLVASALVMAATPLGLPVSTTHVTCGAVAGAGAAGGGLDRGVLAAFLGAWVVTVPLGLLAAAAAYSVLGGLA